MMSVRIWAGSLLARLDASWRRLWSSVSFRLTFNYSLLAVVTAIVVLFFVYLQIVNLLQARVARQTALDAGRLVVQYQQEGGAALIDTVRTLLSDNADVDVEMYLLMDTSGAKLVGNIDPFDADPARLDKLASSPIRVSRNGHPDRGYLRAVTLDNGWTLVVGRDTYELQEIKHLIGQAMLATTAIAIILVMAGTYIFRVALMWRVQDIRDTARRVGTGELNRRVPGSPETDEFSGLRGDINQMLDDIEALMQGVRNVSDSIAHNVRTPLMRVLARLDAAQARMGADTAASQAIANARREILDMITVAEKLLLIAETESGVRRQSFQQVRLDHIVDDVIDLYEPLAAERGIVLGRGQNASVHDLRDDDTPDAPLAAPVLAPLVWADPDLLAGVIVNLVENAIKYAGDGARIVIHCERVDGVVRLAVEDNGPGVNARHMPHLGERFYRIDPDAPGFGLGLASVRAIVSLHDGIIVFEDARPGLRVRVDLPISQG
ncbi:HAMP domain-containing protein [Pusillimonas sp. TS35]|uniref:sensor histidine kinase n=1 Tax=Paracandidimonas lactea TaxID=2895524 RepID=UPI00136A2862|nr:HAMP domain-containing sensor histidine kinase [Paracandidimonas lactea]MYN12125.1 HAMP domain-containing protein [Pusillimonas sp. TS35]